MRTQSAAQGTDGEGEMKSNKEDEVRMTGRMVELEEKREKKALAAVSADER